MKSATIVLALSLSTAALGGCADYASWPRGGMTEPLFTGAAKAHDALRAAPHPRQRVMTAVNSIQDQTGKLSFGLFGPDAGMMLAQALQNAGGGAWFAVVDRDSLDELAASHRFALDQPRRRPRAVRVDCTITSVDSALERGGDGAALLGASANSPYWRISVTMDLRASSVFPGPVPVQVSVREELYAAPLRDGGVKYASLGAQLPARTGFSAESPPELAVREAMEKAVYRLVLRATARKLWAFAARPAPKRKKIAARPRPVRMIADAPAPVAPAAPPAATPTTASSPVPWLTKMQAFGQVK